MAEEFCSARQFSDDLGPALALWDERVPATLCRSRSEYHYLQIGIRT